MTRNRISNKKTLWEKKGGRTFHGDLDTGKYGEKVLSARMNSFPSVVAVRDISDSKRGIADDIDFEILYKDGDIHPLLKSKQTLWHTRLAILLMKNTHIRIQDASQGQKQTISFIS